MSGPVLFGFTGGVLGGSEVNRFLIPINGFLGTAAMYLEGFNDEQMFELYIGGRLNVNEKVCKPPNTPRDKRCRPAKLVPNCTRMKP